MINFAQFPVGEVQRSATFSPLAAANDTVKRVPPPSELQQLQEELERISTRAGTRASQLEHSQAYLRSKLLDRHGEPLGKRRGKDAIQANGYTPASTATPNTDNPASKRVKPNQLTPRVGGSDSENSTTANSLLGSGKLGGDGKHFERTSSNSNDKSPAVPPKVKHSSGTPVQDDFSRVKVTNQVPTQTFWASLEPHFRHITDEDIAFLENMADDQESYIIPRLGKFYAHTWAEEEVAHFPDHMHNNKTRYSAKHLLKSDAYPKPLPETSFPGSDLVDSDLSLNTARLAPLTERIISALVAEGLISNGNGHSAEVKHENGNSGVSMHSGTGGSDDEGSDVDAEPRQLSSSGETIPLEERLKRELRYIGILDDDDVNWADREDDEVCVALRALQRQLHEQVELNKQRKQRLLPIAKEHIGYQEYTQVIDELDKQVEQSYLKRHRLTKSRKRKSTPVKPVALSDNAMNAMDRRLRVIQAIGHLFPAEKFSLPTESVFEGIPKNPDIDIK
ncbi:hypothetical protein GQ54DRAFT_299934 [Martensiomyces pterosporus]|nr:hypothetical protein GQ54DRAFT_299934 [Martensiomyces pterosporus]